MMTRKNKLKKIAGFLANAGEGVTLDARNWTVLQD